MQLSSRQKKVSLLVVALIVLVGAAWQLGRLGQEPCYGGKTVTQWLDSLEVYRYESRDGATHVVCRSAESIASDPALHALSAIGSRAVPVLMRRVAEPAEFPPTTPFAERWKLWLEWKWYRIKGGRATRPSTGNWSEAQMARKTAAGLGLLALGTNAHAGFSRFAQAYAAAPQFASTWGGDVAGMPVGFAPSWVVRAAISALPRRRAEVLPEMLAGLRHTNARWRQVSIECASVFPDELVREKALLVSLTRDTNALVQLAALGALMRIVQKPSLEHLMSPAEVRQAAQAVIEAPESSSQVRDMASTVARLGERRALR